MSLNHAHAALSRALDLRYGGLYREALHHAADLFEAEGEAGYAQAIRADAEDGMTDFRSVRVADELWGERSIMTKDAVATMGGLLPDDAGGRDAVHVAVFSAFSDEKLLPGQDVAVAEQGEGDAQVTGRGNTIGIVDPFLKSAVAPGERFWVYLYPRTITALSHRWCHPAFEASVSNYTPPSQKLESEKWLRDFVARSDCPSYEEVVGKAAAFINGAADHQWSNEYLHFDGQDAHGEIPPEFWNHVETLTGLKITGERPAYFSCSC